MYLKAYIKKLVKNDPAVSFLRKTSFNFLYVNELGQGLEMTLNLNTHLLSLT